MKVKLTDGCVIVALVPTPLTAPVLPGSCVQLEGIVENRNKFKPSNLRILPPHVCDKFDDQLWNDMVAALVENQDLAYELVDDVSEHYGVTDPAPDGSNVDLLPFPESDVSGGDSGVNGAGAEFNESFDAALDDAF